MKMMPASKVLRPHSRQNVLDYKNGHNFHAPTNKPRGGRIKDFDSAVRDEMNRHELKSMISNNSPNSQKSYHDHMSERGSTSANSNAYHNGQHISQPSELQSCFGADPATERALKRAKQVEYKRQLDSFGNNTKDANGRMQNRSQSPEKRLGSDRSDYNNNSYTGSERERERERGNQPIPSKRGQSQEDAVQGGHRPSFSRQEYNHHPAAYDLNPQYSNPNQSQHNAGSQQQYSNPSQYNPPQYNPNPQQYDQNPPQYNSYSSDYGSSDRYEYQPPPQPQAQQSYNDNYENPTVSKSSPTQARLRLVNDMYGVSSVIVDSQITPSGWKPSVMGQGDELDRKRLAALEHKKTLDDQIAQDRRRKELEKEKDRQSDDKAMQRMIRQHEDDRERERVARDALRIAMKKDAARNTSQEKFSEDALARHNRNSKSKAVVSNKNRNLTPHQGEITPRNGGGSRGRGGEIIMTPRKAPITPQSAGTRHGKSPAGSGMHAVAALESRGGKYDGHKAAKKSSALDYQRALDEQIFADRKRKEEAKEKETQDEIAFMRSLRGSKNDIKVGNSYTGSVSPRSQCVHPCRDLEFDPSGDSTDMNMKRTEGAQQSTVTIDRPRDQPAYIERLPFAMGNGPDPNMQRMSMRRAATPGGALECETQMTDENTMMFLQRPYTPSGSGRFAYPHDNMNGSSLQMRQSRSKSNTHPDYEQYESLSYAHERANVRDSQEVEENDTSFISDSQLIQVNERKKLDTEMSMASESLLMYVGGGAQRLKERFAKKASKDKADESPQLDSVPEVKMSPPSKPTSPKASPMRPSTTGTPVRAPMHTRDCSPAVSPVKNGNVGSPNYDGAEFESDREDGPCKWCFGDYYPCRCAEKGRNTASLAQESSPPMGIGTESGKGVGPNGVRDAFQARSQSAQLVRLSSLRVSDDVVPCKWCLGTFVPCFCEEGIPGLGLYGDQADQDSTDYVEGYNNGRGGSHHERQNDLARRQSVTLEDKGIGPSQGGLRRSSAVGHDAKR